MRVESLTLRKEAESRTFFIVVESCENERAVAKHKKKKMHAAIFIMPELI
jgi:hypothetical protein